MGRLGCLNLQVVDELALTEVFFPQLLPDHWRGKAFVAEEGPQPEWFKLLWRKLKARPSAFVSSCECDKGQWRTVATVHRSVLHQK